MTWDVVLQFGTLALAVAIAGERIVSWVLRSRFATTETVLSVHQVLRDEQTVQNDRITSAHHRIDVAEERMKGLPGYQQFNDIKADVGMLKQGQAVSGAKLDALKEGLDLLRASVERIGEELKTARLKG